MRSGTSRLKSDFTKGQALVREKYGMKLEEEGWRTFFVLRLEGNVGASGKHVSFTKSGRRAHVHYV